MSFVPSEVHEPAAADVPFLDLVLMHEPLKHMVLADVSALIDSGAFTNGPQVASFERAFADFCGTRHCVGVASGLDALRLGFLATGVGEGDEVLVPANTFVATFEAVSQTGATPVPVDVTQTDYNIDVAAAADRVGSRTRAVAPVHLYGQLADMHAIRSLVARHDLVVVEDACQAHGASRDGLSAGASGNAGAFSFYPGKNLGAFGDAGALVTNEDAIAGRVVALREHGQRAKYQHSEPGWTARLDTIQALVLLRKLPLLESWNHKRRQAAEHYCELLCNVGDLQLPPVPGGSHPVWHLFPVRTDSRDELAAFLTERGIATGLHYPQPAHLSPAYANLGYGAGSFPVAERLARTLLSLPLFPGITGNQIETVAATVAAFFANRR